MSIVNSKNNKFTLDSKYNGLEENIWVSICPDPSAEIVNLGQGFPDFNPSPEIVKDLENVCHPDSSYSYHQYARPFGHVRLVKILAEFYGKLINRKINPMTEVHVAGGASGVTFNAIMSNIGKGDEVIIIEPAFDTYESFVKLAGGTPIFIPLTINENKNKNEQITSESWELDMEQLRSLFNSKTKAIILNTPNNPLGKVFSYKELTEIGELCEEFDVLIISDEVYEWITFDNVEHVRIASIGNLWDRTLTVGSAGKSFSLTGWKLGWAYGPSSLIRNLNIAHQNCSYMSQTPEQEALARVFEAQLPLLFTPNSFFSRMKKEVERKKEYIVGILRGVGLEPVVPQGGYFILVDWSSLRSKVDMSKYERDDKTDDFNFVQWLWREKNLVGIPTSAFYSREHAHLGQNYIRLNFYKKDETLEKASLILNSL